MKIVESAQKCNPEQIANKMSSIVEQIKTTVKSAARDGDLGKDVHTVDQKIAQRSEAKSTTKLRSIFGEHSFEQSSRKCWASIKPTTRR